MLNMMNELMTNPLFQSALAPLLVALITAALLRPLGGMWAGLGFAFGYAASVYFTTGFQLFPLTSTRKILLLAAVAVLLGVVLDHVWRSRRLVPWVLAVVAVAAGVWVIWPVLKRAEGWDIGLLLLAPVYVAWLIAWADGLRDKAIPASTAALALGVGTGVSAVLGASALLGQLGGAIGAAAGAMLMWTAFDKRFRLGRSFILPVAMLAALIGIASVIYAGMSAYALLPLALIPLAARIPVKASWHRLLRVSLTLAYSVIPAFIAIAISWQIAQSVEPSLY